MGDSPVKAVPAIPRIVGRYAIFDEIASGGMATVYLGRLTGAGGFARTVAIKRLHPQFAKDPEFVAMFLDEARLAARVRHPNVVPTLDVVASKGELFLVMEYVQGESLSRLSRALHGKGERLPIPILLRVISDALQGLHAAHEARDERGVSLEIVHRDVTPQNILVGIDGVGRLLDFGVAKAAGRAQTTREGQIKGKLAYMAPEQLRSAGVSRQTDVYAASVVLWELLTGQRLFAGANEADVIAKLLRHDIQPPSTLVPGIPKALDDVVMRGLAANVEERFKTARDLCVALATCGLQEAAGIVVGEWVEGLAKEALEDRSAKIAAIESQPETDVMARAVSSSAPPQEGGPQHSPSAPTLAGPPRDSLPTEVSPEPTNVAMTASVFVRTPRARALVVAAAVAACLVIGALAIAHGGSQAPATATPSAVAAPPAAPPPAILPPPAIPPPATGAVEATPPPATAPPVLTAAAPPAPARTAAPRALPSAPRPAASTPRPRASAPPAKGAEDAVFDRRD